MKKQYFPYATNGSGDATVYCNGLAAPNNAIIGEMCGLAYLPGSTDAGATVTVTAEGIASHTLYVKATAGTSNLFVHPRELIHNPSDGAALTGTSGGDRAEPIIDGSIKVVISAGGATKTGAVIVYYED